jgi:hypothetical protein
MNFNEENMQSHLDVDYSKGDVDSICHIKVISLNEDFCVCNGDMLRVL